MSDEKELDWDKIMKQAEEDERKADLICQQIREERKHPENYDLNKITERVNKFIEENDINAVYLTEKKEDDNE